MKAMILVLSPEECMNLLNGDLSVLARKKFPKDYTDWVYIYCMKGKPYVRSYLVRGNGLADYLAKAYDKNYVVKPKKFELYNFEDNGYSAEFYDFYGGKVVARFLCNKVEEIKTDYAPRDTFFKECCLTPMELFDYIGHSKWFAIHITKLEIFDKPKEINEFDAYCKGGMKCLHRKHHWTDDSAGYSIDKCCGKPLTRAPRSGYCYIEI